MKILLILNLLFCAFLSKNFGFNNSLVFDKIQQQSVKIQKQVVRLLQTDTNQCQNGQYYDDSIQKCSQCPPECEKCVSEKDCIDEDDNQNNSKTKSNDSYSAKDFFNDIKWFLIVIGVIVFILVVVKFIFYLLERKDRSKIHNSAQKTKNFQIKINSKDCKNQRSNFDLNNEAECSSVSIDMQQVKKQQQSQNQNNITNVTCNNNNEDATTRDMVSNAEKSHIKLPPIYLNQQYQNSNNKVCQNREKKKVSFMGDSEQEQQPKTYSVKLFSATHGFIGEIE